MDTTHSPETPHAYLRKAARREMIAEAARRIIAEKGVEGLRTRDVAERAAINISTLHFHVKSKAALIALVAETSRDAFLALLPPDPDPAGDPRAQLRAEAQVYHDSLRDRPDLSVCFARLALAAPDNPAVAAMIAEFTGQWADRFRQILAKGRDRGIFRADMDPLAAALMLSGALTAFGRSATPVLRFYWPVFDEAERGLLAPGQGGGDTTEPRG
ncbi:TetR/AcrR family transcriptional regulator [Pseudodonghicola flavimaris]|uniref:TetR/AcrR family transcriptional regulator n=1 Tax=Pseudodonghicola flavimaris TaxID=3050036 RepID=A0ABT7F4Y1_9RHOB|nr:TetR/AcrR family transcriptional regulator [Pseudodonghicola flavimaris]MDK3019673.1 TetR/AcrR family transcriptional regulator [Pseudodonghicola flavimaris]